MVRSDRRAIDGLLEEARALIDEKADDLCDATKQV